MEALLAASSEAIDTSYAALCVAEKQAVDAQAFKPDYGLDTRTRDKLAKLVNDHAEANLHEARRAFTATVINHTLRVMEPNHPGLGIT